MFELYDIFLRLIAATFLGLILGLERSLAGKNAGMRTYALVSLGAALFIILGIVVSNSYIGVTNFAPMRTLAAVISGIGFIGAGLIIMQDNKNLRGLTTAAGLWISAAVGSAAGFGFYELAFFTTALTVFVFTGLWFLENRLKNWWTKINKK